MNLSKKILIVHGDARIRRRLALLMADSGFDVRQFSTGADATESARAELYDLALVDNELEDAPGFTFVGALKQIQPTVPMILIAAKLELPLVVQGIRQGLADVIACTEDPRVILKHARVALGMDNASEAGIVSPEELAEVERMLDQISGTTRTSAAADPEQSIGQSADLLHMTRERAAADILIERLTREKAALETELKTMLTQGADAKHLEEELVSLRTERELAAATQAAIDEKARKLSETRAALADERSALESERRKLESSRPFDGEVEKDLKTQRQEIAAWRAKLSAQEDQLADQTDAFRRDEIRVNNERRNLQDELDLFREREDNLRSYEERLRRIQAELEADRVLWFSSRSNPAATPSRAPFATDAALKEAWAKLQRATEIFEAERGNLRDDRLILNEHDGAVRRREEKVRDREIQLSLLEKKLKSLPPPPVKAVSKGPFSLFGVGKNA